MASINVGISYVGKGTRAITLQATRISVDKGIEQEIKSIVGARGIFVRRTKSKVTEGTIEGILDEYSLEFLAGVGLGKWTEFDADGDNTDDSLKFTPLEDWQEASSGSTSYGVIEVDDGDSTTAYGKCILDSFKITFKRNEMPEFSADFRGVADGNLSVGNGSVGEVLLASLDNLPSPFDNLGDIEEVTITVKNNVKYLDPNINGDYLYGIPGKLEIEVEVKYAGGIEMWKKINPTDFDTTIDWEISSFNKNGYKIGIYGMYLNEAPFEFTPEYEPITLKFSAQSIQIEIPRLAPTA